MNDIAKNIRLFRSREGLTQEDLGARLQVTRQTVSSWERGQSLPDVEMLARIAGALGVGITQLIYGEQYESEYARGRDRRIRAALLLGGALALALLLALGMEEAARDAYYRFDITPLRVFYPARMACFLLAGAFAPALLAVWKDIRVRSLRVRRCLLLAGALLLLPGIGAALCLFGLPIAGAWTVRLLDAPWLQLLPGVLLWLGLSR